MPGHDWTVSVLAQQHDRGLDQDLVPVEQQRAVAEHTERQQPVVACLELDVSQPRSRSVDPHNAIDLGQDRR